MGQAKRILWELSRGNCTAREFGLTADRLGLDRLGIDPFWQEGTVRDSSGLDIPVAKDWAN